MNFVKFLTIKIRNKVDYTFNSGRGYFLCIEISSLIRLELYDVTDCVFSRIIEFHDVSELKVAYSISLIYEINMNIEWLDKISNFDAIPLDFIRSHKLENILCTTKN